MYDPEKIFAGAFSEMEFDLGLESGIWPQDSVWYNRTTKSYYRVTQATKRFNSKTAANQFIGWRRKKTQQEKPPVAERQCYGGE